MPLHPMLRCPACAQPVGPDTRTGYHLQRQRWWHRRLRLVPLACPGIGLRATQPPHRMGGRLADRARLIVEPGPPTVLD